LVYISLLLVIAWVFCFTMIGTIMMIRDKQRARQGRHRIPESRLMWMAVLGGAWLMWITMLLVHHKTHRKKFMIGLPIITLIQVVLFILAWKTNQVFIFVW